MAPREPNSVHADTRVQDQEKVEWEMARGRVVLDRPRIAGILNVTPDSFSDRGVHLKPDAALKHAEEMLESGADLVDIGAESTRPGRPSPVPPDEEWNRLEPVLTELARRFPSVPLSVDTVKSETARRALDAGAWAVNDVSGLRLDPAIADVCAEFGAGLILMHSRGSVSDMASYDHAHYSDPLGDIVRELEGSVSLAVDRGVTGASIVLDPGLGFGKRRDHNYTVLKGLAAVAALGFPIMVGPSRKRFLAGPTDRDPTERDRATAAACAVAYMLGASLFRVHAVDQVRVALRVAHAVRSA